MRGGQKKKHFNDLTSEQQDKLLSCKSPEEVFALVKEGGFDLTDKELEIVSGGDMTAEEREEVVRNAQQWIKDRDNSHYDTCPYCGSTNIYNGGGFTPPGVWECRSCNRRFV